MNNLHGNPHNMGNPTLLVAPLPSRSELCGLMIYVGRPPNTSQHARTAHQWLVLKCRMLIFSENQILSSPVLFSDTSLYVIASKAFIAAGQLKKLLDCHGFTERNEAGCQRIPVTDGLLQICLQYTLKARLAPKWNQLGTNLLVQGRDFLLDTTPMSAVKIEFIVQGDQVILSIIPQKVKVPHLQLSDLEIAPKTVKMFLSQQVSTLFGHSIGREWLYTLPGPDDIGYTYPALCVRPQGPIFLPNVDQHAIVQAFIGDLSSRLLNLCGIPFTMSIKLGYFQPNLLPAHHQILQTSQTTPANFTPVALSSLPRGRPQVEKTPVEKENQSLPCNLNFTNHPIQVHKISSISEETLTNTSSKCVTNIVQSSQASDAEIVGGQISSIPQSNQSATCGLEKVGNKQSSRSKWDFPKLVQPQQETPTCETSERKLYKPVFTKKKKAGQMQVTQPKTYCTSKTNSKTSVDGPPAKKSRASKPELSMQDVEKLAREDKFDKLSVAVLSNWLKEHNVKVKVKDKKTVLIAK
ncbi:hypothetical protein B566_EDAN011584, partial [Ephemera danica]